MKMRTTVAVLFLLALCSTVVSAFAQDKGKPAAAPAMSGDMDAMMKAATPGVVLMDSRYVEHTWKGDMRGQPSPRSNDRASESVTARPASVGTRQSPSSFSKPSLASRSTSGSLLFRRSTP